MSEFDDLPSRQQRQPNFFGTFQCQSCDEYVSEGFHDRTSGVLSYKCSGGHQSVIKDFLR